jgi:hypothetical protein
MSIVALKKKTAVKYNNMSVSQPLFSLNGTHRNQGFVGQTSLSRSHSRTLIRNGGYRNYGGCCGTFPIGQIVQSSISTTEDNGVVKVSTKNTLGLLHVNKYQCLWRGAPYTTVKLDSNHNLGSQSNHIKNVQKSALVENDKCNVVKSNVSTLRQVNKSCEENKSANCEWIKPISDYTSVSQSDYLLYLNNACAEIDIGKISQNRINCNSCPLPGN